MPTLAIDFGTSNSAAAVLEGGAPRRIALEAGADGLVLRVRRTAPCCEGC